MRLLFILPLLFLPFNLQSQTPAEKEDSITTRILIIKTFDPEASRYRKNKKQLFSELTDSLQQILAEQIRMKMPGEPIVINERVAPIFDSKKVLDSLLSLHHSHAAIVIKQLDVYFEQTKVEVTRDYDGSKNREAYYDICSEVNYTLYQSNALPYHSKTKCCDFFNTRSVMSGLFAAGPDIVGKSNHAFAAIRKNAELYLSEIDDRLK